MKIKPILITGSHRSGTTWVGKVISSSKDVAYIHEPFNLNHRPGIFGVKLDQWMTHIKESDSKDIEYFYKRTLNFEYNTKKGLQSIRKPIDIAKFLKDYLKFKYFKYNNCIPLIKDPIAILSSEWLSKTFDMNVIVMIRHPAAFISSLIKLNWHFDFNNYLTQPSLMADHFSQFKSEIVKFSTTDMPIIDQGILLWKTIHSMIDIFRKNHNDWLFIRHEDISREPFHYFNQIFDFLGLKLNENVKATINKTTSSKNPKMSSGMKFNHIKLNSEKNIFNWKNRLSIEEVEYIRENVKDISKSFYTSADW